MSLEVYKVLHVAGILLLVMALGGLTVHSANGGTRESNQVRRLVVMSHGIALAVIFVAGFGLMMRVGIAHTGPWPGWLLLKMVIWLVLGGAVAMVQRMPQLAKLLFFLIPALGVLAAYAGIMKPF